MVPEGWKLLTLDSLVSFANGKAHENDVIESGQYVLVNSKFISTEGHTYKRTDKSLCPASAGDILMVMSDVPNGRAIAKCFYVLENHKYTVNQRIARIRAEGSDPKFIFYAINRNSYYLKFDDGITQTNLRKDEVLGCPIRTPPLPEQRKIAQILSTWDASITATERLLENSQKRKKGLMQQLLTGKKRLPGFEGEWEEKSLGKIAKFTTGASKSNYVTEVGDNYIIDMGSVSRDGKLIPSKKTTLMSDFLQIGQLVMPKDDIGGGNIIGRVGIIEEEKKYILADHVYALEVFGCNSQFLCYLINSYKINKNLRRKANGTAQLGLGKKDVQNQVVIIPCSLEEQQAIAQILTTADQEIEALKQRLECLKQEKKALMQQLLTGKKRVKVDAEDMEESVTH